MIHEGPAEVLLIEDNLADVELARAAFEHVQAHVRLHHAPDAIEALRLLGLDGEADAPMRPDFILLDLNLPRLHGREFLARIKADPRARGIPVIVFTSSKHEADVAAVYELQASCYLVKPIDFTQFIEMAKAMDNLWFRRAARPPRLRAPAAWS